MEFGARHKGFLWKLGSWLIGGALVLNLLILAIGPAEGGIPPMLVFDGMCLTIGAALSLPYGLRRIAKPSDRAGLHFDGWFGLAVAIYVLAFRLYIWVGDIILTLLWRVAVFGRSAALARRHDSREIADERPLIGD